MILPPAPRLQERKPNGPSPQRQCPPRADESPASGRQAATETLPFSRSPWKQNERTVFWLSWMDKCDCCLIVQSRSGLWTQLMHSSKRDNCPFLTPVSNFANVFTAAQRNHANGRAGRHH